MPIVALSLSDLLASSSAWIVAAGILFIVALVMVSKVPLGYNFRNLTVRWLTTLITGAAFTLVMALVTVMFAFVNGMKRTTENTGEPGNVLVLADGSTDEVFSNLNASDLTAIENLAQIVRDQNGEPLASRETYMVVNQPIAHPSPRGPKRRFLQARGIDRPLIAATVHNVKLLPGGSWFSDAGSQQHAADPDGLPAIQAVLGDGVARELGQDRTAEELAKATDRRRLDVGDTFRVANRTWIVVGILDAGASAYGSEIWAKQGVIGPTLGKDTITTLVVRTPGAKEAAEFKTFLDGYPQVRVTSQTERAYYAGLSETTVQFTVAIMIVAVAMSVGGVFGIMNTMYASVSQRIKDIGVLRLVGYSRFQVLVSFMLESLVIAMVGGLLGCALGTLANGMTVTSVLSSQGAGGKMVIFHLIVDASTLAIGTAITLLTGLAGGLFPSLNAMRLSPLEALR